MGRPRKYKTNADRQAAYRRRLARGLVNPRGGTPGTRSLVTRVLASDAQAKAVEES
jgi:hypothetical protein